MAVVSTEVKAWCIQELLKIRDVDDDLTGYILSLNTASELESYLRSFLDLKNREHQQILVEFSNVVRTETTNTSDASDTFSYSQKCSGELGNGLNDPPIYPGIQTKKKAPKFVPLYGVEGQSRTSVLLPGRHPCECLAQKHDLVNNCTDCGRIVCKQEGSGPCFFCGALVCTKEEQEILARNSKKSHKLHEKLLKQGIENDSRTKLGEGLQRAIAHKNRLIEYDKSGVRRTKVIDDECDYFASDTNKWLSQEEREVLKKKENEVREKRYGSRRQMKVTLDFAGRKVVDENEPEVDFDADSSVLASGYYNLDKNTKPPRVANLNFPNVSSLKFVSSEKGGNKVPNYEGVLEKKHGKEVLRIQDKEFQEMSDTGACLSMHQPWASLLVLGIKRVEGRTWYSAHRGRLWIAAAAKQPTQQEIAAVESMYKTLYGNENVVFPEHYPVSCLLGCVDLMECLAQEDYKEEFPEGESESPYVFICENPQQLALKFPVKGQHKIWKLDPAIHKAAKGGLRKSA